MEESDAALVDQAIAEGKFEEIRGSHSVAKLRIIALPSGKVVQKRYYPRPALSPEEIDRRAEFNRMVYSLPGPSYINKAGLEDEVAKEVRTLKLWDEAGIPTPKVLHYDGTHTIILEYLEGHSTTEDLVLKLNTGVFSRVLDSFARIRAEAKNRNDKDFLHSDPYTDNFFYDTKKDRIVSIDPSKLVKKDMSLAEADARMNILFMCKLFLLSISEEHTKVYVHQFAERLSSKEKALMATLNADPAEQRAYFATQNLQKGNILDIYFREDVRAVVQKALTNHV